MDLPDLTAYTDDELDQLRRAYLTEQERRVTISSAPERAERISRDYLNATGSTSGEAWAQPTGAHNAYPQGWAVIHNGKTWESLTPANVWEPGVSGWREVVATDPGTGEMKVPEWVQPTGAHDSYNTGDLATFEGILYESLIDGNVYSPTAYPQGWREV